jgi:dCMP deaminase
MTPDERPSRDDILMLSANLWARRSSCSRSRIGVVIASTDGRILITGYNGAPAGMQHCNHNCTCRYVSREAFESAPFGHVPQCPADKPCLISVHAEANAIARCAMEGIRIGGAQIFTTFSPCVPCAQLIISSGISRVVWSQEYRDHRGLDLLDQAGLEVVKYGHETD